MDMAPLEDSLMEDSFYIPIFEEIRISLKLDKKTTESILERLRHVRDVMKNNFPWVSMPTAGLNHRDASVLFAFLKFMSSEERGIQEYSVSNLFDVFLKFIKSEETQKNIRDDWEQYWSHQENWDHYWTLNFQAMSNGCSGVCIDGIQYRPCDDNEDPCDDNEECQGSEE